MKFQCENCKKKFDFDNYNGLCPKCGQYHRKATGNDTIAISKTTNNRKNIEVRKAVIYGLSAFLVIAAAVSIPLRCFVFNQKLEKFLAERNVTSIIWDASQAIEMPESTMKVINVVELIPTGTQNQFPEGKKLIGVRMQYLPKEMPENDNIMWGIPIIMDENQNYKKALEVWNIEPLLLEGGEKTIPLLDSYYAHSYEMEEGYFTYLVEDDLTSITVLIQREVPYENTYTQIPTEVYQLTLPIEQKEVLQ